jgi:hypothetical protein
MVFFFIISYFPNLVFRCFFMMHASTNKQINKGLLNPGHYMEACTMHDFVLSVIFCTMQFLYCHIVQICTMHCTNLYFA